MDYQQKYLKYKNKYLELKKQIYGGLRVDDNGRKLTESTVALPETISDRIVFKIDRSEGRCLVVGCQCAGYESNGGKSIGMMEDPDPDYYRGHLADRRNDPYQPKIPQRKCVHCDHNLGSHALKVGLNKAGEIVNFISYKDWVVEHLINNTSLDRINKVSLYSVDGKIRDLKSLGLLDLPETREIQEIKGEKGMIDTNLYW